MASSNNDAMKLLVAYDLFDSSASKKIGLSFAMQYLYKEENLLIFMDPDSFEQVMIDQELMKDKLPFLTDGMNVEVEFYQDKPLGIVLAQTVVLEIQETDPVIKGSTVTSSYKPAIMTNGLRVMVPPYLVTGEKIIVKTEDATFVKRAE